MSTDPQAARVLLEKVVCGDLPVQDPDVQRALRELPEMREALQGLLSVQQTLASAAAAEKATLAAAARAPAPDAPVIDAAAVLRRLADQRPSRRRPHAAFLAVAAAILVAALVWWTQRPASDPLENLFLEQDRLHIVGWSRSGGGLVLEWRGRLDPLARYRVRVYDKDGQALTETVRTTDSRCTFSAADSASWRGGVRVVVEVVDELGTVKQRASKEGAIPD